MDRAFDVRLFSSKWCGIVMFLTHTEKPGTKWRKWFNSYNANFIWRALIYGLIFKVQNKLNLLEGKEVWPIKMTKSDFLDAKHISDYALNIYEASDADRGDLFLLCHQNVNLILFLAFLPSTLYSYTANILLVKNTTFRRVIFPMHFQCPLGI